MEYRRLGRTGFNISVVGFGAIQAESPGVVMEIIDEGQRLGINHIDTARMYGRSEELLGLALSGRRDQFHICSRTHSRSYDEAEKDLETGLELLKTDYLDVYQVHELADEEDLERVLQKDGAARLLEQAKKDGRIGFTGVSSHHLDAAAKAVETGLFDTLLIPFSPVEYSAKHLQVLKLCQDLDVGVTAMKPLSGGGFIKRIPDTLSFILQHDITAVITGLVSAEQVRENADAVSHLKILSLAELDSLMAEAAVLGKSFCRRCRYCLPCEQEIPISDIMMSDAYLRDNPEGAMSYGGKKGLIRFQEALDRCTRCGECIERCPYDLAIPDLMPGKVAFFEEIWRTHFEKAE